MFQLGPCIAIVDDDPGVLRALARLVAVHSFRPCTFLSARDFLESLSQTIPDCLILDLQMPEKTGLDLQRELARKRIKIPTVVITAERDASLRPQCEAAGAVAFLLKPLDQRALIAALSKAVSQPKEPTI